LHVSLFRILPLCHSLFPLRMINPPSIVHPSPSTAITTTDMAIVSTTAMRQLAHLPSSTFLRPLAYASQATSSRITLQHFLHSSAISPIPSTSSPRSTFSTSTQISRGASTLAHPTLEGSGLEELPPTSFTGSLAEAPKGKGKEKALEQDVPTPAPRRKVAIKAKKAAISMVSTNESGKSTLTIVSLLLDNHSTPFLYPDTSRSYTPARPSRLSDRAKAPTYRCQIPRLRRYGLPPRLCASPGRTIRRSCGTRRCVGFDRLQGLVQYHRECDGLER
jgi:hypothetical protein